MRVASRGNAEALGVAAGAASRALCTRWAAARGGIKQCRAAPLTSAHDNAVRKCSVSGEGGLARTGADWCGLVPAVLPLQRATGAGWKATDGMATRTGASAVQRGRVTRDTGGSI
jgi:hypothetical protein